jgi:2'-5' RNA ligase
MRDEIVSYWCLTCAADSVRLSAVIRQLAAAQGAPPFEPHLTLGSLAAAADMSGIAESLSGLSLDPAGLDGTEAFMTSLFVRFNATQGLLAAREKMAQMPASHAGRTFDPHVSLCYGRPPPGSRSREDVQALLASPVRFDRLAAVLVTLPVSAHAQVAQWRIGQVWPF